MATEVDDAVATEVDAAVATAMASVVATEMAGVVATEVAGAVATEVAPRWLVWWLPRWLVQWLLRWLLRGLLCSNHDRPLLPHSSSPRAVDEAPCDQRPGGAPHLDARFAVGGSHTDGVHPRFPPRRSRHRCGCIGTAGWGVRVSEHLRVQ